MRTRVLIAAGVLVGSLALPSTVGALDCTLSNTGPDSNNTCIENIGKACYVTNNNKIFLTSTNQQIGTSGSTTVDGNTNGGDSQSGDVDNSNEVKFSGVVDNSGACVAAVTPAPTPAPTPTPAPVPEQPGHVESAQVQAPVGGVGAGAGGTDNSGLLVGLLGASTLAVGAGLRRLCTKEQQ